MININMNEFVGIININELSKNLKTNKLVHKCIDNKFAKFILTDNLKNHNSVIIYKENIQNETNINIFVEDNYLIIGNGQISNIDEIIKKLNINKTKENINEILLLAYKKFGIYFIKYIEGKFAFIIWDRNKKQLLCYRDQMGIKTLFYNIFNDMIIISTHINYILDYNLANSNLNNVYFLEYLTGGIIEQQLTPYKNITRLKPGNILIIDSNGIKLLEYWNITNIKKIHYDNDYYFEYFKKLLEKSVYSNIKSSKNTLIELSGGLDSSSIIYLTKEILEKKLNMKNNINSFTIDYGSLITEEDDLPFVKSIINNENFNPIIIDGSQFWYLKNIEEIKFENELLFDEPNTNILIYNQYKLLLNIVKKYGIDTIISGEGGDHLLSWNKYYLADYLRHGLLTQVLNESIKWSKQLKIPIFKIIKDNCLLPLLGIRKYLINNIIPPWINKKLMIYNNLDERIGNYYKSINVDTIANSYQINIINNIHEILDGNVFAKLIEINYPYLYIPLIEYIFGIPIDKKVHAGELNKYILRYSLKDTLPGIILNRKNKAGGERRFLIGLKREWPLIENIINNSSYIDEFIDKKLFLEILNCVKQGFTKDLYLFSIGRTLSAKIWLKYKFT